jgi:hypothetical protein
MFRATKPKPIQQPIAGTKPPSILDTTGSPKPATGGSKPARGALGAIAGSYPRANQVTLGATPAPKPGIMGAVAPAPKPGIMGALGGLGGGMLGGGGAPASPQMTALNNTLRGKPATPGMKKGGAVKVSSASKRADGIAVKGKTKGKIV